MVTTLVGMRVIMDAADHPYADREGVVIREAPCQLCSGGCNYPDLIVRLDDGTETRVYEPECSIANGTDQGE